MNQIRSNIQGLVRRTSRHADLKTYKQADRLRLPQKKMGGYFIELDFTEMRWAYWIHLAQDKVQL
jgi:hypothetical protein